METANRVRVFIASPGDVGAERDHLARVIGEINFTLSAIAPEKNIILELIRWETHVAPGLGADAQDVVNRQIGEYDIFVGIMWKRFGTPTSRADSGTEEEFRRAYALWQKDPSVSVLFYFSQAPFPPPKTSDEIQQLAKVVSFRDEISSCGLVAEYPGPEDFADAARRHLTLVVGRMKSATTPAEAAERSSASSEADLDAVRTELRGLAGAYETLRETMPSGSRRTTAMSAIAAKMRILALRAYPLLTELTTSASAGERLAAVVTLQEIPHVDHLTWLADRVGSERPFVAYQATRALLSAATLLVDTAGTDVASAVARAERTLDALPFKDPNQVGVLHSARRLVERRSVGGTALV